MRRGKTRTLERTNMGYVIVALLAILFSLALLAVTKIPAVVMLVAATLATGVFALSARLIEGYWNSFWVIAVVFAWFYAAIVALAFIGIGRWLKWPYFLAKATGAARNAL